MREADWVAVWVTLCRFAREKGQCWMFTGTDGHGSSPSCTTKQLREPQDTAPRTGNAGEVYWGLRLGGSRADSTAGLKARWKQSDPTAPLFSALGLWCGLPHWPPQAADSRQGPGWQTALDPHQTAWQPLGPISHSLSGAGPGPAEELPSSWQVACPPCAVILLDHLRENGWVPWPAPRRDNKGWARVIHPRARRPPSPPAPTAAPCTPQAWASAASSPQWPPDNTFKVLMF